MKGYKRQAIIILTGIVLAVLLFVGAALGMPGNTVMAQDNETADNAQTDYQSLSDFGGKRIGVVTGAIQGAVIENEIPTAQLKYYNNVADLLVALDSKKIDGFSATELIVRYLMLENGDLTYLDEALTEPMDVGAIFAKTEEGSALREEFNEYLAENRDVIDELEDVWLGEDESQKTVIDISSLSGENGTLVLGTDSTMTPDSFIKDNEYVGIDIDIVLRFCKDRGYALEIRDMSFGSLVDAVVSGKCDFAVGAIAYTGERAESVDFSDPMLTTYSVIAYSDAGGGQAETGTDLTLSDLQNAKIGVATGTLFPDIVHAVLPDTELFYFNTMADMVNALKSGKIDAFAVDEPAARNVQAEDDELARVQELLDSSSYAYILTKNEFGEKICAELDEYILALKDDGTLEDLQVKWFDSPDLSVVETTDYRDLPATNGTIRLSTNQYPPFIQCIDGLYSGYEIEILAMFCRDCGYALDIEEATFDGILAAVQSGKADIGCSSISVTDEREQVVLFSEPDYEGGSALVVLKDATTENTDNSVWSSIRESFEKTFIRENRWKLFLEGIGTTLLITALSILFGTLLGFFMFMLCRNGNRVANAIAGLFVWLIRGMPVVVLLMILYYIIFGSVTISGTAVSVVGFTLVFGAGVFSTIKGGVGAIDRGQFEAAYALGYTNRRAFFRVILPQAMPHFMPAYKSSITELIKATAIVGYVAVQDLTKMGDIIRSRTYEAFFPLIAVAIIYFILAAVLIFIVNRIELRIDSKRRKPEDILKNVK